MKDTTSISGYRFTPGENFHAHAYLLPAVEAILSSYFSKLPVAQRRIFDLGCGNGSMAAHLTSIGYEVTGVDPSVDGIQNANQQFPELRLEIGSGYDPLAEVYGRFPAVISLEVVEHLYAPRDFAQNLFELVDANGIAIVSTPYHGYLKNLMLAATGKLDQHFTALWDHGHIKFWSVKTLGTLLAQAGFEIREFRFVGRTYPFSKSMLAVVVKR